jgi:hypothetical protein
LRLLFVGESPPASGRFFYRGDSGLYRAMRDAFRAADSTVTDENFLSVFQASGCYLIDLCLEPVDRLDAKSRRLACQEGERGLSTAIAQLQPSMIAILLRSIERNVAHAARMAEWHGPFLHLPYPGRWSRHRKIFMEAVAPEVERLLRPHPSLPGG